MPVALQNTLSNQFAHLFTFRFKFLKTALEDWPALRQISKIKRILSGWGTNQVVAPTLVVGRVSARVYTDSPQTDPLRSDSCPTLSFAHTSLRNVVMTPQKRHAARLDAS